MKTNRILVTGGAGLIGSQVVQDLNEQGITDIIISDHLGTSEKFTTQFISRLFGKGRTPEKNPVEG